MPRKGMRTILFKASPSSSPTRSTPHRQTFSDTLMDENFENARELISKWDASRSSSLHCDVANLFASDNRYEAQQYLNSIKDLQTAMQYYISQDPTSDKLVLAQNLMQIAMKRLEKEFYIILKSRRQHLDPESVSRASRSSVSEFEDDSEEDELSRVGEDSISEVQLVSMDAMKDLKAIAECMIRVGYGKDCVKIFKIIRKSVVDEALYHLNVESMLSLAQIQKMDWEVLEVKIKAWLHAVKVAVKTLFYGERVLCDQVFSSSPSLKESCFADITREGALSLFVFPENVAKCKKAPERIFRTLDLYEAIADLWTEIEPIFDLESTSTIRQQVINSLNKLGEAVRATLTEFETAITKSNSKSSSACGVLTDILADWPLTVPSPLPEAYFGSPVSADGTSTSSISIRLAWLILVMLCKLDGKAEIYKDVALSYLFLANNLQYVVNKVQKSSLKLLLGDEWMEKHEEKVWQYASNYERMGWSKVFAALPDANDNQMTAPQVTDCFKRFNSSFEEAYNNQASWVVSDSKLRDQIKVSVARKLVRYTGNFMARIGNWWRGRKGLSDLHLMIWGITCQICFSGLEVQGVTCHYQYLLLPRHFPLLRVTLGAVEVVEQPSISYYYHSY
ncbi:exocyst complex component EXO70H1-like [Populus alba x Populus x berolinensis]|nr:exocyst complex component EXO70H1-like [Populus alba x Populus x berolinensis]